jgi:hypothetical protein
VERRAVEVIRGEVQPELLSGYGYGYGSGYGYGDGDGYGSGYGDGSGSGDGSGEYWSQALRYFLSRLPADRQIRAQALEDSGARLVFWRSARDGQPANGGRLREPATAGVVHREKGPLRDECGTGQLHGTMIPTKWNGDRWWIVALIGDVRGDEEKYWALERELIGECGS